jgi:putative membrane protein
MASETELRDQLAVDRTHLANERTLLAYVRTALAMVAGGAGVMQLLETPLSTVIGAGFVTAGLILLPIGIWRFLAVRRHLHARADPSP